MNTPFPHASRNGTIVLFGEVLADIFPDRTVLGGAPFNAARHLKAFGQNPVLITRLGNDALRDEVFRVMSQNGMETLGIRCNKTYPTGRVQVHIEKGGHRFEILSEQACDFIHSAVVRMTTLSANPVLVYFGTLAQRHPVSERALKTLLRSTDAAKFLDINLHTPWYDDQTILQSLQYANIVKLNNEELDLLAKMFELAGRDAQSQVQELMDRFAIEQVMVTCGEAGAWHINRNGKKVEAGVTGADADMLRGNTLGTVVDNRHLAEWSDLANSEKIYFAKKTHAAGILEAMDHYNFFASDHGSASP